MRIGIDMLAVQSPHHRQRGIGRYSSNLVESLLRRPDSHEYVLYVHEGLPFDLPVDPTRAKVCSVSPRRSLGESVSSCLQQVVDENPQALDLFLVLSPFEIWSTYSPPSPTRGGPRLASVVYDLIPFLFQNDFVPDPKLTRHYRTLDTLQRYDCLLAISEATRRDCLSTLKLDPGRVLNIGAASDSNFFRPADVRAGETTSAIADRLAALGVTRPFVFTVGGLDDRKNTWRLIKAFASLPDELRTTHQLVLTFWLKPEVKAYVLARAAQMGLDGGLVLTGLVSDDDLRVLYQNCSTFVFPSTYEGFGLPILEALHCGAPVVAGNNSSQVEVLGDAGLLANAHDVNDLSEKMGRLLRDAALREDLRRRGPIQAGRFSWAGTAASTVSALEAAAVPRSGPQSRPGRGRRRRPTVAFFSPFPPRKSGISDYSASLLAELRETYDIDLFHDRGYVPEPALPEHGLRACDSRLFERMAAAKGYHAVVYQMGNSRYHNFMYDTMLRHPGLVTLHDYCLAGFHLYYRPTIAEGKRFLRDELLHWYPEDAHEAGEVVDSWPDNPELIPRECVARGWFMNRHVIDSALRLVVHSPWCQDQVASNMPHYADRVVVIPLGTHCQRVSPERRVEIRERFGLPGDALLIASFGFIHPDKMIPQALEAFVSIVRDRPDALYLLVGEEVDGGYVRDRVATLGLETRVRFLGRQPAEAFQDLVQAVDLGMNLRIPPTNGETSAALLNLLGAGIPTVVTDVATFGDFPAHVVRKFRWETEGQAGLQQAMTGLALDRKAREALGRAAFDHVERYHEWSKVAARYVDAIERTSEAARRRADKRSDSWRVADLAV